MTSKINIKTSHLDAILLNYFMNHLVDYYQTICQRMFKKNTSYKLCRVKIESPIIIMKYH